MCRSFSVTEITYGNCPGLAKAPPIIRSLGAGNPLLRQSGYFTRWLRLIKPSEGCRCTRLWIIVVVIKIRGLPETKHTTSANMIRRTPGLGCIVLGSYETKWQGNYFGLRASIKSKAISISNVEQTLIPDIIHRSQNQ